MPKILTEQRQQIRVYVDKPMLMELKILAAQKEIPVAECTRRLIQIGLDKEKK